MRLKLQEARQQLTEFRARRFRFPPGVEVMMKTPPADCGVNFGIVDNNAALSAVRVVYVTTDFEPAQAVVAESDLTLLGDCKMVDQNNISETAVATASTTPECRGEAETRFYQNRDASAKRLHNEMTHQELANEVENNLQAISASIWTTPLDEFEKVSAALKAANRLVSIIAGEAFTSGLLDQMAKLAADADALCKQHKAPAT